MDRRARSRARCEAAVPPAGRAGQRPRGSFRSCRCPTPGLWNRREPRNSAAQATPPSDYVRGSGLGRSGATPLGRGAHCALSPDWELPLWTSVSPSPGQGQTPPPPRAVVPRWARPQSSRKDPEVAASWVIFLGRQGRPLGNRPGRRGFWSPPPLVWGHIWRRSGLWASSRPGDQEGQRCHALDGESPREVRATSGGGNPGLWGPWFLIHSRTLTDHTYRPGSTLRGSLSHQGPWALT